jgi:hypothetical protein
MPPVLHFGLLPYLKYFCGNSFHTEGFWISGIGVEVCQVLLRCSMTLFLGIVTWLTLIWGYLSVNHTWLCFLLCFHSFLRLHSHISQNLQFLKNVYFSDPMYENLEVLNPCLPLSWWLVINLSIPSLNHLPWPELSQPTDSIASLLMGQQNNKKGPLISIPWLLWLTCTTLETPWLSGAEV